MMMGRLIDGDRLYDCVEARYRQSSGEEHKAERGLLDAICDMPTIAAIPVEWMEQQFYDNPKSQWAEKCRDVYTKWQKWQRWQKEQEAR